MNITLARGESRVVEIGVVGGGGLRLADHSTMRQDDGPVLWLAHRSCGRVAVSLVGGKKRVESHVIGARGARPQVTPAR